MKRRQRYDNEYEDERGSHLDPSSSSGFVLNAVEDATPADWCESEAAKREIGLVSAPEEQVGEGESLRRKRKRGSTIGQFFTGGVLSQDEFTRRLPVFVFVVFLMLLYIANGFHLQHKYSRLERIADELKRLKTEAVTISAVRMTSTRQSEIEKLLEQYRIPLMIDNTPPRIIEE